MKKLLIGIFTAVLALSLVLLPAPAAQAADIAPGDKVSVSFTFENTYGISGEFVCENPELVSGDLSYSWKTKMDGDVTNNMAFFSVKSITAAESITITVSFKLNSNAKVGDKCTITFYCDISDQYGDVETKTETRTVEVTVLTHPTTQPTTQPTTRPTTAPTQATTKPTTPVAPTTQPTVPTQATTQPTEPVQPTVQPTEPVQPTTPEQTTQISQSRCNGNHTLYITLIVGLALIILFLIGIILILLILLSQKNRRRR